MVTSSSSPTVLKRWIAFELRKLREDRSISREEAAAAIKGSVPAIGHVETGRSLPKPLELERLLELYGVPERAEFFLDLRLRAKKGRDWWIGFDDSAVPEYFKLFLGLESSAVKIESWDAIVVPGLFQTPDYARAIIRGGRPEFPATEVEKRVELRMARQDEVLDQEDAPQVWAVISEAALRLRVGSPAILNAQLEHLVELREHPNIEMQVLPATAGAHTGAEGAFTVLTFPNELEHDPGCVYTETRAKGVYYEEPAQVMLYRDALTRLRVQADKPEDFARWVKQTAKDL
ncbi:transcriptional regulator with XRE-family HTH domain [Saccharothrix ecbatanensis]|uniref:Transcriptional regulator with XRE-family HTH domain n=1 Tax=Saccharothrix ecbatanensis TaxID=1105145 RepID=A0A7W9HRY3_9PSEU|nr:helix-turn-helix transcriptional regulator [Saccharothrix ecbatanensis]MBB5807318.1 transcriptional regulator with XRE-family HTH domain [Saccharothrix ecbatanensis]